MPPFAPPERRIFCLIKHWSIVIINGLSSVSYAKQSWGARQDHWECKSVVFRIPSCSTIWYIVVSYRIPSALLSRKAPGSCMS